MVVNMEFTKENVAYCIENEGYLKEGDKIVFDCPLHGNLWRFSLKREDSPSGKYKYALDGDGGEYGMWRRRYRTIEDAFLHVLNNLNENSNIKNRYDRVRQWTEGALK